MSRLCRQIYLPAGLAAVCVLLAVLAGRGTEQLFRQGVSFSGIQLAVTAPEGDPVPELVARYLGNMKDVSEYCTVRAMDQKAAEEALERRELTAIVVLPEDFVQGIRWGRNPDVRVIVNGQYPLESLLVLWLGNSACDLLSAFQAGVYCVSDLYREAPPAGLSEQKMLTDINLDYIQWSLTRTRAFEEEQVLPTGAIPVAAHYRFSFLLFLFLTMSPVFAWNYQGSWLNLSRRLWYVRRSPLSGLLSSLVVCTLTESVILLLSMAVLEPGHLPGLAGPVLLCGLCLAVCGAGCGLVTRTAAGCGSLSFALGGIWLGLSGGIVPPVLMPPALRRLTDLSPVTWMRDLLAWAAGYDTDPGRGTVCLLLFSGLLAAGSALLYRHRCREVRL